MAADFKSHILSRDEKGFGGIPFKRLLFGGIAGGLTYTVFRLALPNIAVPVGIVVALVMIVMTAPRGGLPLWMRLWLNLRGRLLLSAVQNPLGIAAELAKMLSLSTDAAMLDSSRVFAPPAGLVEVDLSEWVTFARARDLDRGDGLVFVSAPLDEEVL
ncbi:MAG: hypothetical protein BroJett007_10560 [Chloroflexota bacterium]|nr:MAG: hypothetical protein BroJett007_10560 [Chloroflexota bacterium]